MVHKNKMHDYYKKKKTKKKTKEKRLLVIVTAHHHDVYGYTHDSRGSHAAVRYIGLQSWDSVDSLESLSFL